MWWWRHACIRDAHLGGGRRRLQQRAQRKRPALASIRELQVSGAHSMRGELWLSSPGEDPLTVAYDPGHPLGGHEIGEIPHVLTDECAPARKRARRRLVRQRPSGETWPGAAATGGGKTRRPGFLLSSGHGW